MSKIKLHVCSKHKLFYLFIYSILVAGFLYQKLLFLPFSFTHTHAHTQLHIGIEWRNGLGNGNPFAVSFFVHASLHNKNMRSKKKYSNSIDGVVNYFRQSAKARINPIKLFN
jgi:hypothetical protein